MPSYRTQKIRQRLAGFGLAKEKTNLVRDYIKDMDPLEAIKELDKQEYKTALSVYYSDIMNELYEKAAKSGK